MAVAAPELHVRALGQKDVAEGGVAGVGRAGQQREHAVNLAGEQHRVAVEGHKGVFDAGEGFEIGGFGNADGRAVEVLAPDNIIGILHLDQPRVVGVGRHKGFALFVHKGDLFGVELPVDAVGAAAQVDEGDAVGLLAAEHPDVGTLVRHHRRVEDARHAGDGVAADDRVFGIAPQRQGGAGGFGLPGDVGQGVTVQFYVAHSTVSFQNSGVGMAGQKPAARKKADRPGPDGAGANLRTKGKRRKGNGCCQNDLRTVSP